MERIIMTENTQWLIRMAFVFGLTTIATVVTFCVIVCWTESSENVGGIPYLLFIHTMLTIIATMTGYETFIRR